MRPVYMLSGGITKFAKAHPGKEPNIRIEGGGATGGLCFQAAVQAVASGRFDVCAAIGFETMSTVETWKGNDFIALASDTHFDYPLGGFYTGYYAMMAVRHMHEFGTTEEQMVRVAVKNYGNAAHNPFAQDQRPFNLGLIEFDGVDTLFMSRLIGIEQPQIGLPVRAHFRRKMTWLVNDAYFIAAAEKEATS